MVKEVIDAKEELEVPYTFLRFFIFKPSNRELFFANQHCGTLGGFSGFGDFGDSHPMVALCKMGTNNSVLRYRIVAKVTMIMHVWSALNKIQI